MEFTEGRIFIGRLNKGDDLLMVLTDFCRQKNIRLGTFSLIGALKSIQLGYYLQQEQKYTTCLHLEDTLEIATCTGNISLKDSDIFVHAHIVVADHQGQCYGGHLMEGAEVFAVEYIIHEIRGKDLERVIDKETGLSLWKQ